MEQNIEIVKDFCILDSVQRFFWLSSKLLHIDFFFFQSLYRKPNNLSIAPRSKLIISQR